MCHSLEWRFTIRLLCDGLRSMFRVTGFVPMCHTCFALTTLFVVAVLLPGVEVDFRRAPDALVVVDIRVEDIFRCKFYKKYLNGKTCIFVWILLFCYSFTTVCNCCKTEEVSWRRNNNCFPLFLFSVSMSFCPSVVVIVVGDKSKRNKKYPSFYDWAIFSHFVLFCFYFSYFSL